MPSKQVTKRRVGRYSDKDRQSACIQYAICGNMKQVSKITGIPRTTIIDWKDHNDGWWDTLIDKIRHETTDRHVSRYTGLIDKLLDRVDEDVPNMRGKDAGVLSAVFTDKSQLLMSRPTSISGKAESMEDLKKLFEQMAGDKVLVPKSSIIEGPIKDQGQGQSDTEG